MNASGRLFLCIGLGLLFGCNVDPSTCVPCQGGGGGGGSSLGPTVNLRVAADGDAEALEALIGQLRSREMTATVLADADFVAGACEFVRELSDEGFELAVFARPEDVDEAEGTLSTRSREEQQEHITQLKDSLEDCLGADVEVFHCADFDQNEDSYDIVDELGFSFNLGFVAHTERTLPGYESNILPYQDQDVRYGFWAVPMHSVPYGGQWVPMCDASFIELVTAAEWGDLLSDELGNVDERNRPLTVEVHTESTGTEGAFFDAFVAFLDEAGERDARFMTVAELVEWSQSPAVQADCGCQ